MKYVLDSSVAAKWVLREIHSDKAQRLRDESESALHELLAPDVFTIELAHTLTRAERQTRILPGNAYLLWSDVLSSSPQILPHLPLLPRAIALSSAARIGVYDCLYVALAEQEECEFVTADERLVNALQRQFPFILSLVTM